MSALIFFYFSLNVNPFFFSSWFVFFRLARRKHRVIGKRALRMHFVQTVLFLRNCGITFLDAIMIIIILLLILLLQCHTLSQEKHPSPITFPADRKDCFTNTKNLFYNNQFPNSISVPFSALSNKQMQITSSKSITHNWY